MGRGEGRGIMGWGKEREVRNRQGGGRTRGGGGGRWDGRGLP